MDRMGLIRLTASGRKASYEQCQSRFQESLPADAQLYNEYHALLDQHAKVACAKVPPLPGLLPAPPMLDRSVAVSGATAEDAQSN